jgi:predicted CXXCH cytochrome family protein
MKEISMNIIKRKPMIVIAGSMIAIIGLIISGTFILAADPQVVSGNDPNAACVFCHNLQVDLNFANGEKLSTYVDYEEFQNSRHTVILKCTTCHYEITGYPHPAVTEESITDYKIAANEVCGKCHTAEQAAMQTSIHGMQGGSQISVCSDCHTAHYVQETDTSSYRLNSVTYCSDCHGDEDLMKQYNIPTYVVRSYLQDFHGKTTYLIGEQAKNLPVETATCSDCHGSHDIKELTSENEAVIKQNLANACRKCHVDASDNFTSAWLSHKQPSGTYAQIAYGVSWFYTIMIPFVLVGLIIHIVFDVYTRRKNKVIE